MTQVTLAAITQKQIGSAVIVTDCDTVFINETAIIKFKEIQNGGATVAYEVFVYGISQPMIINKASGDYLKNDILDFGE